MRNKSSQYVKYILQVFDRLAGLPIGGIMGMWCVPTSAFRSCVCSLWLSNFSELKSEESLSCSSLLRSSSFCILSAWSASYMSGRAHPHDIRLPQHCNQVVT